MNKVSRFFLFSVSLLMNGCLESGSILTSSLDPNFPGNVSPAIFHGWSAKMVGTESGFVGNGGLTGSGIVVGSDDSVYVTGAAIAGNFPSTTSNSIHDIFITKYTSAGTPVWVRQIGTLPATGSDVGEADGKGIAIDSSDNIYVLGQYTLMSGTSTTFDSHALAAGTALLLVKYNSAGVKQFSAVIDPVSQGAPASLSVGGIAVNPAGTKICVSGFVTGNIDGGMMPKTAAFFTQCFDGTGTLAWVNVLDSGVHAEGINIGSNGNVTVVGSAYFGSSFDLNTPSGGDVDYVAIQYNSAGVKQWSLQVGGGNGGGLTTNTFAHSVATDSSNNVYIGGTSDWAMDGIASPGGVTSGMGRSDGFLIKLDSSGARQWTKLLGNTGTTVEVTNVAITSDNQVYVGGSVQGMLGTTPPSGMGRDAFVSKYDPTGAVTWLKQFGDAADLLQLSMARDSTNSLYISGLVDSPFAGGTPLFPSDRFVMKYGATGSLLAH